MLNSVQALLPCLYLLEVEMVINQQADKTALDCDDTAKLLLHLIVMMMVK